MTNSAISYLGLVYSAIIFPALYDCWTSWCSSESGEHFGFMFLCPCWIDSRRRLNTKLDFTLWQIKDTMTRVCEFVQRVSHFQILSWIDFNRVLNPDITITLKLLLPGWLRRKLTHFAVPSFTYWIRPNSSRTRNTTDTNSAEGEAAFSVLCNANSY